MPKGKSSSWNFAIWLEHNRYRADLTGDLARDAANDSKWPRSNCYLDYKNYLEDLPACDGALSALEEAWTGYELYVGGESQITPGVWHVGVGGLGPIRRGGK